MERMHAYKGSDGSLHKNSRDWVEHEFYLMLCQCTLNADKGMAAEFVDRFKEFQVVYNDFETDVKYGEGKKLGLVLDRRTRMKEPDNRPTTAIPEAPSGMLDIEEELPPQASDYINQGDHVVNDPEWRNKRSRDHPTPLSKGQSDDVAF